MRLILRVLGVILALVFVAIAALFLLPSDRIASLAAERFETATGRELTINGRIRPQLWPTLGIRVGDVEIANAPWSDRGPMVTAEALSVAVDWSVVTGGDLHVRSVELIRPSVLLETGPEGQGNWDLFSEAEAGGAATPGDGAPAEIGIDRVSLSEGALRYFSKDGAAFALAEVTGDLAAPAGQASFGLNALANGEPIELSGEVDDLPALLSGVPSLIGVALTGNESRVTFDGSLATAPELQGAISAELGSPDLFRAAGAGAPALPPGLGADRIVLAGDLSFDGTTVVLSALDLALDQNQLAGDLQITLGGNRPRVTGALSSGGLDFSALGGPAEADVPDEETGPEGWSTEPIDISGMRAIDADVTLSAGSIALPTSQWGRTSLRTKLDDARAVTEILELQAYDGSVQGGFVVNGRNGLSASANLSGSAIAISRLFAELFDYDRLISLGDMSIKVLAVGNSMDALLNSMDGEGSFAFGAGELLGLDIIGALQNLDIAALKSGSSTIFDSIEGTFQIVDGVVTNTDLALLAPLFTAEGSGQIGLGGQTLDYRIVPRLLQGDGAGLSVPITVKGSWAAPRFGLDLEGLVEDRAEQEIDKALDRVEQEVQEEVEKELGLTEGQSLEDELKDRLEEEAGKALRSLFD